MEVFLEGRLTASHHCLKKTDAVFVFSGATFPSYLFTVQQIFQVHYQFTHFAAVSACVWFFFFIFG